MIKATTSKPLSLVLPNTNKALAKVLQDLSPKELQIVSQGKDLKSIINTFLKQSSKDSSQDKILLNLVKNNPTLKNLGSLQNTLKELISSLKKENQVIVKEAIPLEKTLSKFLDPIKEIKNLPIKDKIENSGVFLESKLKNLQTPKQELKQVLQELSKLLDDTKLPNVKEIQTQLKSILKSEVFKNISGEELFNPKATDLKDLSQLTKKVQVLLEKTEQRVVSSLDKSISKNDVIFTKDFKQTLDKAQLLNKPEQLLSQTKTKELLSNDFKAVLLKAHEEVSQSSNPNKTELLKQIDKLTLQIDYHQLVSHLSNSSSLYIPYEWDALEDGTVSLKNPKNGKFFCDIDLQLKEYGELKLRLGMFENNQLSINISTQNTQFKSLLQEGIPQLKKQLLSIGIIPKEIRFLEDNSKQPNSYVDISSKLNMGFEVKA